MDVLGAAVDLEPGLRRRREVRQAQRVVHGPRRQPARRLDHTYSHEYRHARRLFAAVIDAVRDRDDVQAIIQIGSAAEIPDFGELPTHVRVVKVAPQLEILGKADVLITQAGHGSVMEASYFGVPMLAFPCWYDQFGNAARVAYHGTGIVGDIARINGVKIADMLEALDRGEFKAAASRMRAIFRSETRPAAGVEVVEQTMRSTSS